jgi:RecB family exonuclease
MNNAGSPQKEKQLPLFGSTEPPTDAGAPPLLLQQLAQVCGELPLEEKVLVAPSLAIGHQIVERLAREGHSWINLRVETISTLAHGLVGSEIAREGLRLLSRAQTLALIEQACSETLTERSYFGALRDRPGFHRALQRTLEELRAAGISPAALPARAFAEEKKLRELKEILRGYEQSLEEGHFVDRAEILERALEAAKAGHERSGGPTYLLPEGAELSVVERTFLERLASRRLRILTVDPPSEWVSTAKRSSLLRAIGEENEIREVFRRILHDGIPLDEVEILHTDAATYPALAYELSREHGIACTFESGTAVSFTRPGQAALAFLDWIGRDFEAEVLRRALASGTLTLRRLDQRPEGAFRTRAAAREFRQARIGWGRERHLPWLDRLIADLGKPDDFSRADEPRSEEETAERAERRARRLAAARGARVFAARALELSAAPDGQSLDLRPLARGCREFVTEFARVASELDGTALLALQKLFEELEELPSSKLPTGEAVGRLRDAVRDLQVAADRPRPGFLHIAHYRSGGFSGRRQTFLLGLDAARHPGRDLEDPVLLDQERQQINRVLSPASLALHRDRPREAVTALEACLARLRGQLTASFSCWNVRGLSQQGEQFPSPFFLGLYRERSGHRQADYSALLAAIPGASGFIPGEGRALDETEWWLSRVRRAGPASAGGGAAPIVRACYPHLSDGHKAEQERESSEFTIYDGWVRSGTPELDPRTEGKPQSSSRIETLARCPFMYFLKHVLKIEPPEEVERDTTRWLDPMRAGSLLHEVFRLFFERITAVGEAPNLERHRSLLESIAEERIRVWREKNPPASELAFGEGHREILFACHTFLKLEEAHCREFTPRFFEVPFGLARATSQAPVSSRDPVQISLGDGQSFLLRGSIDRIDEAPDGSFHVWDYKTGSTWRRREELGLHGGRQIQHALYAMALEEMLLRGGIEASVSGSGYFFPGRKGEGQRFRMPLDPGQTQKVLRRLFDLLLAGVFPHAVDQEDCRYCDYGLVCGGPEVARQRAKGKFAKTSLPVLKAFREIHDRT